MITKEQFIKAYDKYPANKLSIWFLRYFSKDIKKEDLWVKNIFVTYWIVMFLLGFISAILEYQPGLKWCTLFFSVPLVIFAAV